MNEPTNKLAPETSTGRKPAPHKPSAELRAIKPPKIMPGLDPNNRAYDPGVRTRDLTNPEKRARRQMLQRQREELEAKSKAPVVAVTPIAGKARMRSRHWGLIASFGLFVLLPLLVTAWYLQDRAVNQFASTAGFTVQQERGAGPTDILSGAAATLTGGSAVSDTDILYEFIQSQQLVSAINDKFDLIGVYSRHHDRDPIFSIPPDATLEDLVEYWSRVVRISYDESARLIELRVLAYDPRTAQAIAQEIITQSQQLINDLNQQSREDSIRYARIDLDTAEDRLSAARSGLILFRTRTQIVDPESDLAGRMGVVNTLQQQLAEALVEYDLLAQSTNQSDPRLTQNQQRIDVIRARLREERANVTGAQNTVSGEDYPTLLAEYEGLVVAREIAEQMYRTALASLELARADAARQSRYLSAYIQPTLPQTAEFPRRMTLLGLAALFIMLTWTIAVLIYYSIRDSR